MGGLIPNPHDQEIVARLNWVFSGNRLDALKVHNNTIEPLFDNVHTLHRVAVRIGAVPTGAYRTRWVYFLHRVLPAAMQNNVSASDAIKRILRTAMTNDIAAVTFQVTQDDTATWPNNIQGQPYYVYPSNDGAIQSYTYNGNTIYSVTLVCQANMPAGNEGDPEPDPGANEQPINIP